MSNVLDQEQAIARALAEGRFWELASLAVAAPDCVPVILHRSWRSGGMSLDPLRRALCAVWVGTGAPVS